MQSRGCKPQVLSQSAALRQALATSDSASPQAPPLDLFNVAEDEGDSVHLRELLRRARHWILLLDGERADHVAHLAELSRALERAQRVAETQSSSLRLEQLERRKVQKELEGLRRSHEDAVCERDQLLREERTRRAQEARESPPSADDSEALREQIEVLQLRSDSLEADVARERQEKQQLEDAVVEIKIGANRVLEEADSQDALLRYYEAQLKVLNPAFEPPDLNSAGPWNSSGPGNGCEMDSALATPASAESADRGARRTRKRWSILGGLKLRTPRGPTKEQHAASPDRASPTTLEDVPERSEATDEGAPDEGSPQLSRWERRAVDC